MIVVCVICVCLCNNSNLGMVLRVQKGVWWSPPWINFQQWRGQEHLPYILPNICGNFELAAKRFLESFECLRKALECRPKSWVALKCSDGWELRCTGLGCHQSSPLSHLLSRAGQGGGWQEEVWSGCLGCTSRGHWCIMHGKHTAQCTSPSQAKVSFEWRLILHLQALQVVQFTFYMQPVQNPHKTR